MLPTRTMRYTLSDLFKWLLVHELKVVCVCCIPYSINPVSCCVLWVCLISNHVMLCMLYSWREYNSRDVHTDGHYEWLLNVIGLKLAVWGNNTTIQRRVHLYADAMKWMNEVELDFAEEQGPTHRISTVTRQPSVLCINSRVFITLDLCVIWSFANFRNIYKNS